MGIEAIDSRLTPWHHRGMQTRKVIAFLSGSVVTLAACTTTVAGDPTGTPSATSPDAGNPDAAAQVPIRKAPELGTGDHTAESVVLTEIAGPAAKLNKPRDLAFNTLRPDELWVVNWGDDSMVIVTDASTEQRTSERRKDSNANHFMAKPAAIAFGADATTIGKPGTFATCGESRNTYDDQATANDFMGPALWSSDLSVFAKVNPHGLGSHLDMLHNTPLCMGIAHESDNAYWTFGGLKNSIDRYNFALDHHIGQDDHSDGDSRQYITGQVKYQAGVASHVYYHAANKMLYIADSGNGRVVVLDTTTGTKGAKVRPKEPMGESVKMDNAVLTELVTADSGQVTTPSGIEVWKDHVYVSDYATGRISAFTLDGELVNYLDTGLPTGGLAGMAFGPDGKLYFVDTVGSRVLRVDVAVK